MKVRITGTKEECDFFTSDMEYYYDIISVSDFYPNNRKVARSKEGRVYIEARIDVGLKDGSVKTI